MKVKMQIIGIKQLTKKLQDNGKSKGKGMRKGLYRAGLMLQRASQKLVPIDTSNLKNSASTRMEGQGLSSSVIIGYGTEYAIFVHENLEAQHKVGQAKYLEQPLREMKSELQAEIKAGLREDGL